jgi:adenylylsulfate kinase
LEFKERNICWHDPSITAGDRHQKFQHKSCVIWFTGLSAAGKSTLANALCSCLHDRGVHCYVLDGDNVRHGLNKDLGFSKEDRKENIRRIGEVAKLFVDAGLIVLAAFISPFREDRENVRNMLKQGEFIEIYVKCPLDVCEKRDPKGAYKKARSGHITEFTGISSPYEEPLDCEIVLDTDATRLQQCVDKMLLYLQENDCISARNTQI